MQRQVLLGTLVIAVLVAGSAFAGEGKCSADTQTCLNKMASNIKAKGWVGVELDHNDDGQMIVAFVEPEIPAMAAGIQEGDILLAFQGIALKEENNEKLAMAKQSMKPGKEVTYTVERSGCCHKAGGTKEVNVTLAEIPDAVLAKWVGGHMLDHAVIEVAEY